LGYRHQGYQSQKAVFEIYQNSHQRMMRFSLPNLAIHFSTNYPDQKCPTPDIISSHQPNLWSSISPVWHNPKPCQIELMAQAVFHPFSVNKVSNYPADIFQALKKRIDCDQSPPYYQAIFRLQFHYEFLNPKDI